MPATYAHYVFGERAYRRQSGDVRELIDRHRQLYDIGLHGPDILFYYKPLKRNPVSGLGYAMHGQPAKAFFAPAAKLVQENTGAAGFGGEKLDGLREQQEAYLLGFLCHFALDCTCHGYIENKIHRSKVTHTEIETEFDRRLMVNAGLDPQKFFAAGHIVPSNQNAAVIAPFFPGVGEARVEKALRSLIFYSRLLIPQGSCKRAALHGALRIAGKYEQLGGWIIEKEPRPACADSCLRLEKLMDRALELVLKLTPPYRAVLKGEDALAPEFDRTFDAGQDWQSIPVLPLEEELTYEVSID